MMLLWLSRDDYTRGLEPNIVAELAGLVAGIIVTYFIVDRVVSTRFKAHNAPLLHRLRARIDYAVAMLGYSWAVAIGEARGEDAAAASSGKYVRPMEQLLGDRASSTRPLLDRLRSASGDAPLLIATLTVENATRITDFAERLASVVATDVELQKQLADLDSIVSDLDLSVRHWSRVEETAVRESEATLVESARAAFEKALALQAYAKAHL